MVAIPKTATDEDILSVVRQWVEVLASKDYDVFFSALGYACSMGRPGTECIQSAIDSYRSPRFFPGTERFNVTDWRTANGGNPRPLHVVTRYKPNAEGMAGAVDFDLPLNGRWSDLNASFVLFESTNKGEEYVLSLEDISSGGEKYLGHVKSPQPR